MAFVTLGSKAVGGVVKLNENGKLVDYLIVHQGKPSNIYDASCDGTWLLRQDIAENRAWNNNGINKLEVSAIHDYLNGTWMNRYDTSIKSAIKQVKIPYRANGGPGGTDQSGANGLSCKIFLLSGCEIGLTPGVNFVPADGTKLAYFESGFSSPANAKRVAKLNGSAAHWWLRSPGTKYTDYVLYVDSDGNSPPNFLNGVSRFYGVRPALILPPSLFVSDDGTVTTNTPPSTPPSLTLPDVVQGGVSTAISWGAASDPDGNLEGYLVERSYDGGSAWAQIYQGSALTTTTTVPLGTHTVMFRVCAYDTAGARSGWRTSSNKTVLNNRAPGAPPSIAVPLTPSGGAALTVTWTASADPDGNLEGYVLERQWDGAGVFTQIYKGAALSHTDDIPKGAHTSVTYRVRAYDAFGVYSAYTASPARPIDNNMPPVIESALSGDLGTKTDGFDVPYTVTDAEQQDVTVTEQAGGLTARTHQPALGEAQTFSVTGDLFQRILNGPQAVRITAQDAGGKDAVLELTFTKAVHKVEITLAQPLAADTPITVAVIGVLGSIPADAAYRVALTNNGLDENPIWEDATQDAKLGRNHVFENKTAVNGPAFNFRVTAERGESGQGGYITSIQGGFQ